MRRRVWRLPQAEDDLLEIWLFVARDSVRAADRLLDAISDRCWQLLEYPEIGPARPDIGPDIRVLSIRNYLVLYRMSEGGVEIVRVAHGSRDIANLL
jgi:toxin ParE1/3/4